MGDIVRQIAQLHQAGFRVVISDYQVRLPLIDII